MKLGWNITLNVDDYHTLLRNGKTTFGKAGAIYVQKQQDGKTNDYFGVVGFNFGVEDLPPKAMFLAWVESIYDNDPESYERLSTAIREHQMGKLVLEKQ